MTDTLELNSATHVGLNTQNTYITTTAVIYRCSNIIL